MYAQLRAAVSLPRENQYEHCCCCATAAYIHASLDHLNQEVKHFCVVNRLLYVLLLQRSALVLLRVAP